ncbi:MAG: 50S ribosomal protein L13 [Simkaniaceae bacterium]|nr:50S ribosomal protein L13 [Simkaniaceae bacterium]
MSQHPKTVFVKKEEALKAQGWFVFDATGKTLGRFASEVSKILRGKHKTTFTPHVDCGDGVIVVNVEKIAVTGAKEARETFFRHTGHIGGLKEMSYREMQGKKPDEIVRLAVWGMMPKTRLGRAQMKHLRLFTGPSHNMQAQQPVEIKHD